MKPLAVLLIGFVIAISLNQDASALSLKVSPLQYKTELTAGQSKKGFIDISNPTTDTLTIRTDVQAFRQIDDDGSLEFYTDPRLDKGIQLDLDEFQLGPREAIRMYFILDGTDLPAGDVFGAIFFSTIPVGSTVSSSSQQVRVGTILSIVNGTPSSRSAEIVDLSTFSVQFGTEVKGAYVVKNTGDPAKTTGFYPDVRVAVSPFGTAETISSKLVFAGRSRETDFSLSAPPIGIYQVSASYGDSTQSRYILVIQPVVAVGILVGFVAVAGSVSWLVKNRRMNFRNKK